MKPWKLLLADDHDIVIAGLRMVLDQPRFEIVGTVKDGRALVQAARDLKPNVVVTDVTMPLLNGSPPVPASALSSTRSNEEFGAHHREKYHPLRRG